MIGNNKTPKQKTQLKSYSTLKAKTPLKSSTATLKTTKPLSATSCSLIAKTPLKAKQTSIKVNKPLKSKGSTLKTDKPLKAYTPLKINTELKASSNKIKTKQQTAKKTDKAYFSIFGPLNICVITGEKKNVVPHHIFEGPYKIASEKYGFILPIRKDYHTGYSYSIHEDSKLTLKYKIICEHYYVYVLNKTKNEFIKEFGHWY